MCISYDDSMCKAHIEFQFADVVINLSRWLFQPVYLHTEEIDTLLNQHIDFNSKIEGYKKDCRAEFGMRRSFTG